MLRHGPDVLRDDELLAVVLGTAASSGGALAAAAALVARFPDWRRLAAAGVAELEETPGVGLAQACRVKAALALAGRLAGRPLERGERLYGPSDVYERVGRPLAALEREVFLAVSLDVKHRVLAEHRVAEGGVCAVPVIPRDVFACVVRDGAAAAVFVHNHPSGDPSPSDADRELTARLRAAGELIGVQVLDHVIVGQGGYFAFTEGAVRRGPPISGQAGGVR